MNKTLQNHEVRILKLAICVMIVFLEISIVSAAQSTAERMDFDRTEIRLSSTSNSRPLLSLISEIELMTNFKFAYDRGDVEDRQVVVDGGVWTLGSLLKEVSSQSGLAIQRSNNSIALVASKEKAIEDKSTFVEHKMVQQNVSGTITNEMGESLPGATIIEKGTTNGTVSDAEGHFNFIVQQNAVLLISFVGYLPLEVPVDGRSVIDISLQPDVANLQEVVVVGYGTQKKINLTGSVANIDADDIKDNVASQASQILAGELSGVTVIQGSGNPGKDGATIRVRGVGTFSSAGSAPLVLIDGIPGGIDDVMPSDIESVSVLKDAASAAIYGARAANGVILIKTKEGKSGGFTVNYNGYVGMQKPTEVPDLVNSWEYAELANEAALNQGQNVIYTDEDIQNFKSQSDPVLYPNTRRYDWLLEGGNGLQTNHDLRLSGGSGGNRYSLSLGYLSQNGIMAKNSYDRYNMRLNLSSQVSKRLNFSLKLAGKYSIQNEPHPTPTRAIIDAMKLPPTVAGRLPDGTYGHVSGMTLEGWFDSNSFAREKEDYLLANLNMEYAIVDGLTINGLAGVSATGLLGRRYEAQIRLDENAILGPSKLTVNRSDNQYLTLQTYLKYDKNFNDNQIGILAGYSQEENVNEWDRGFRDNFPSNSLYQLNAGSGENMQSFGSRQEWGLRSLFARINYSFKDKYLLELNARYDGSSRFPKGNQYDVFPSASAAWRISSEEFFNARWVDDLKIRASYGELGNQNIGLYPYQQTLALGQVYVFGGQLTPGAATKVLPNKDLTWETTKVSNIGLDLALFESKLSLTTDYFIKRTEGILYNISSSRVLGLTPSEQNAGIVENKGIEIQLSYRNEIGNFKYEIVPNFSVVKNEVVSLFNVEEDISQGLFVGEPISSIYGYEADGLFVDDQDVASYPTQPYNAKPGYIRLRDISGPDGIPDGVVTPAYDRKVIGNEFPKYAFGGRISMSYKGFDFAVQLQGLGGKDDLIRGEGGLAFYTGSTPQRWMMEERWTPENPDRNAKYPLMENTDDGHPLNEISTYWLRSAAFLRINNLQFGYTFPSALLEKIKVRNLRTYFSGSNLYTFDGYYEGWDPEMTGVYPPTAVYTLGINLTF